MGLDGLLGSEVRSITICSVLGRNGSSKSEAGESGGDTGSKFER
jgi:hypothetical protein